MSLDDPTADPLKWGSTTLGTESGQIGWAMDLSDLKRADGYSLTDFEIEVEQALARWEDVADVDFGMVDASEADVLIGVGSLASGAGLASVSFSDLGSVDQILSGTITMDADRTWTPEGQTGGSDFFAVALHEVGHILGLGHIDDSTQIMSATVRVDDLGGLDIAAVRELYGEAEQPDEGDALLFEGEVADEDADDNDVADRNETTSSSEDDGGGGIALLLGLFAAVIAFFFGGGGGAAAAVAVAAGDVEDDEDVPDLGEDGLPPAMMVDEHVAYLPEDGAPHGHGCDCACCAQEQELENFI